MIFTAKELFDFTISATDGEIGSVHDILFDDEVWKMRYFVVDTGGWLVGRKVIIAPYAFGTPDRGAKTVPVELAKDQVKDSPDIATDPPLSRDAEIATNDFYRWPYYWGGGPYAGAYMTGAAPEAMVVGDTNVIPDPHPLDAGDRDPSLRSARAIIGYSLSDRNDALGEITDLVFEMSAPQTEWELTHLVVDLETGSGDRRVLVPKDLVEIGTPDEEAAYTRLTRDLLEQAPTVPEDGAVEERYFDSVGQYYGRHR